MSVTYYVDADSSIIDTNPDYQVDSGGVTTASHDTGPTTTKSVLHFDLSEAQENSFSAKLRLHINTDGVDYSGGDPIIKVYRLRVPFVEGEVTWNSRSSGVAWTTPGIGSSASDYYDTVLFSGHLSDWAAYEEQWVELPLSGTFVAADFANGFKVELDPTTTSGYNVWFCFNNKDESSSYHYPPELILTYNDAGAPTAELTTATDITSATTDAKQFTVTYTDDTGIDVSSLATGNLTITGPHSYSEDATFVSVDTNTDGTPRVATYSAPAPTGGWDWDTNGDYTIAVVANQVADISSGHVAAGTLGAFSCDISGGPILTYTAWNARRQKAHTGDSANHTIKLLVDGVEGDPWQTSYEPDAINMPGQYAVGLTAAQAAADSISLGGKSTTANVRILAVHNVPGPWRVADVNITQIDGSATAATNLKADALSIIPGTVFDDAGTHTGSTTVIYTTLPQRGTNGYKFQFATFGQDAATGLRGVTRYILSSADVDTYTQLTFETALSAAPADDVTLIVQGNAEAKV